MLQDTPGFLDNSGNGNSEVILRGEIQFLTKGINLVEFLRGGMFGREKKSEGKMRVLQ